MPGLYTGSTGLWGGYTGLLFSYTSLSTPPGFLADAYSPAQLFLQGEQGVWYDPSDFSAMFQDSAGTTPVTAVEQPVGLILDKSKSLAIGPELVTNGTFDSNLSGWTVGSDSAQVIPTWTSSGVSLTRGTGGTAGFSQNIGMTVGKWYALSFNLVSGNVTIGGFTGSSTLTTLGQQTRYYVANSNTIQLWPTNLSSTVVIDNISVKEIAGNHASQTTSTSRPVLSARVNLLTYTEDWRNTATAGSTRPWTYSATTVTVDATTAPDGTSTADALFETATTAAHLINQQITGTAGFTYRASVSIKANGRDYAFVRVSDTVSNVHAVSVNLTNGTAASANGSPTNITCTAQANGFYRVTFDAPGYSTTQFDVMTSSDGVYANRSFLGDITKGVYVWGADLRQATAGSSLPPYQRVGAATDYSTSGFPYYLKFDGTDDFLVTGTINPGSVDKAQVFAGVRKLSDAVTGVRVVEISVSGALNAGTFTLNAPQTANGYGFRNRGSAVTTFVDTPLSYASPITNVVTGLGDISGDSTIVRVNGSVAASDTTTDQGTGNYLSYPMYIGSRGGIANWFNGHLYGLIVRFSSTNLITPIISQTEQWMNSKTLAY